MGSTRKISILIAVGFVCLLGAVVVPRGVRFFHWAGCKQNEWDEAKTYLSDLRTAEQSFHKEHGFYTTDLVALGFRFDYLAGHGPRYLYGFARPGPDATPVGGLLENYDANRRSTIDPAYSRALPYFDGRVVHRSGKPLRSDLLPEDTFASETTFRAAAVADIDRRPAGRLDVWYVDPSGFEHAVDDCDPK